MEKDIKKLLSQETLTGEETGRIMILDLLLAYKSLTDDGYGIGLLSDAEKIQIVNRLSNPDDISRFNDYRGVHEYLTTVSAVCDSFVKTYEIHHWRLYHLISDMEHSEEENSFSKITPLIMTENQYKEFIQSGTSYPFAGIAILQNNSDGFNPYEKGGYHYESKPKWRDRYSAENIILNYSDYINESLCGMKDALAECLARIKVLELIGRYIKVNQIKILIPPIDESKITLLNDFMTNAINRVRRTDQGKQYEQDLKQKLSNLLTPVDLSTLTPDPQAIKKARSLLNFTLIKNRSESFVSMIKKDWK